MNQYIVTSEYVPAGFLGRRLEKFRVNANDEEAAKEIVKKHPLFTADAIIVKVRKPAYKKIKN